MVLRQHDPMVVEEMVVAERRMYWRTRRWVEVTNPIPQVQGGTFADELVNDDDDATLGMNKGNEREDVFAKDGSLPDPARKVQIKGCTASRRLALRWSSRRETTKKYVASALAFTYAAPALLTGYVASEPAGAFTASDRIRGSISCRHMCSTSSSDRVCACRCLCSA